MKFGKRILSALLAAVISLSSAGTVFVTAYAADDEKDEEKTFDGEYYLDETVDSDLFETTENSREAEEALEKRLLSVFGKRDLDDVTFRDLLRPTSLALTGMELEEIPACLNYMTNLRTLNLSNNRLRNSGLSELNLIGCTKLTNVNLSLNYLSRVPSWFINSRVTTRNITQNFITGEDPRSIKALEDEYYYVNGEPFDEDALKRRILDSIRFNDNSLLPDFIYDYDYPAYNGDVYDESNPYPYELDFASWDLSKYIDENGYAKIDADTFVDVTVCLFKDTASVNTKTTVRVFLLDGKSANSIKQRLDQLLKDYETVSKDKANYTEGSWNRLDAAQQTAKAIREYSEADMEMLSNALSMLNRAMNGLERAASTFKPTIDALVKVGGTYKEENYSPSTWAVFKSALDDLKALQSDKDASASRAQRAIKAFQRAQLNLSGSSLSVPAVVPKSDFEAIYGEDLTRSYSGTLVDGKRYTWTFNGRNVTTLKDFNPEVKTTADVEENILIEAGSPSRYRLFSTVQDKEFPGKATLELDVSGYADGDYYLYKWNSSEKRSKMIGRTRVKDGKLIADVSEGGVYYASKNVSNFELKMTNKRFNIDHNKKNIVVPLIGTYNVSTLRNSMEFGSSIIIADNNGDTVSNVSTLYRGMTVNAPNGDKYTIRFSGDINDDGEYDVSDVMLILDRIVNDGDLTYCDINGSGFVDVNDVMDLLRYIVEL